MTSSKKWEGKMHTDIINGEWVYFVRRGHPWNLMMFKCFFDGYNTYTLRYGSREMVCNRESFVRKGDMSQQVLAVLQIEEEMARRDREHTS